MIRIIVGALILLASWIVAGALIAGLWLILTGGAR